MRPPLAGSDGGLLRFTTAGSVDDGKSTLIGRLLYDSHSVPQDRLAALERDARRRGDEAADLSLLTDGLMAEREQGITIDVAYSYFATPRRKFIIADAPGHEQYTRNMVTAASTVDAAVILIDAARGMTTQSRRHFHLSHLLRVPQLVIALNKMDLVDFSADVFRSIAAEIRTAAAAIGAPVPHFVPISAKFGDNVVHPSARMPWYQGQPLLGLLETLPCGPAADDAPFRFPVQLLRRVETAKGAPRRQYLGRVESGRIKPGDPIAVMPSGAVTRIRNLSTYDGPLAVAEARQSIAIELEDELDVARGDILAAIPALPRVDKGFEATLCWLADEPFHGQSSLQLKIATRSISARIEAIVARFDLATSSFRSDASTLGRNDIVRVRIALAAPLAFDAYEDARATGGFILIDPLSHAVLAAGMIARR